MDPERPEEQPHACYCCHQPLTFSRKPIKDQNGETVIEESWDCTNEACISYRQRRLQIPTPPLKK